MMNDGIELDFANVGHVSADSIFSIMRAKVQVVEENPVIVIVSGNKLFVSKMFTFIKEISEACGKEGRKKNSFRVLVG